MRERHVASDWVWLRLSRTDQRVLTATIGVLGFVLLMALGAHVRIPLPWTPVPVTLQTLFLPLAGASLGAGLGALSQALYLALGAAGAPVFAGSLGLAAFAGPTGGYLIGFIGAALLTGRLVGRGRGLLRTFLAMAAGLLVVYGCGTLWLAWLLHLSLAQALLQGVVPFLLGDLVKTAAAAALFRGARGTAA